MYFKLKINGNFSLLTGQYLYINGQIEANDAENVFGYLRTARVDFPPIVPRNMSEFCISFWYSMYGKDVKTLRFYVKVSQHISY